MTVFRLGTPALTLVFLALSACSGNLENQIYQGAGPANLVVRQTPSAPGFLGTHKTSVAVYRETGGHCVFDFVGTIKVRQDGQPAALPVNERLALNFNFMGQPILFGDNYYSGIARMFTARAGHKYELQMSAGREGVDYHLYDVTGGQRRILKLVDAKTCR